MDYTKDFDLIPRVWTRAQYIQAYDRLEQQSKKHGCPEVRPPSMVITGQPGIAQSNWSCSAYFQTHMYFRILKGNLSGYTTRYADDFLKESHLFGTRSANGICSSKTVSSKKFHRLLRGPLSGLSLTQTQNQMTFPQNLQTASRAMPSSTSPLRTHPAGLVFT